MTSVPQPVKLRLPYGQRPRPPLSTLAVVAIVMGLVLAAALFLRLAIVIHVKVENALLLSRLRGQPAAAVEADLEKRGQRIDAVHAASFDFPPAPPVEREEHFVVGGQMVRVRSQQGAVISIEARPWEYK